VYKLHIAFNGAMQNWVPKEDNSNT